MHRKHWAGALAMIVVCLSIESRAQSPARNDSKPARPTANAARQKPEPTGDVESIIESAEAFTEAFNRGDAKSVAALWTKDGEYIDEDGERFVGHEAIEKEYASFFKANPGAKITLAVDSVRQISDSAAIEDGRSLVELSQGAGAARYTVVHVKTDGKWLMSSVRDGQSQPAVVSNQLAGLEWLVGDWSASQNGAKLAVNCRWIENKKFLERSYSVKRGDKLINSGRQIIGWNAQAERIQSWNFTSDGGHAVGTWTPDKQGWAVQTLGMLADGTPTESVNLVTPIDANAIAWSSIARSAGGTKLQDVEKVLLKRVDASH